MKMLVLKGLKAERKRDEETRAVTIAGSVGSISMSGKMKYNIILSSLQTKLFRLCNRACVVILWRM